MAKKSLLEEHFTEPFSQWQKSPSPESTSALLKAVSPVLDKGVAAYAGPNPSPNTRSRARRIALQALKSYDPSQAKLATHLTNHLQGLRRVMRQEQQVLSVPERMSMDAGHITQRTAELSDRLGREPSMVELADATGLSVRRLQRIQQMQSPIAEGTMEAATMDAESGPMTPATRSPSTEQHIHPSVELVYHDVDPVGQKILEGSLGLFGKPVLSNQDLARRLRLSPGAISQRKALLQQKLDEAQDFNLF
jgi:DNA-directed RNA polymerase specialized sigma subunit